MIVSSLDVSIVIKITSTHRCVRCREENSFDRTPRWFHPVRPRLTRSSQPSVGFSPGRSPVQVPRTGFARARTCKSLQRVVLSFKPFSLAQPEHPVSLKSVIVPRTCTSVFDDDNKSIRPTSRHNVSKLHIDFARGPVRRSLSAVDVERRHRCAD